MEIGGFTSLKPVVQIVTNVENKIALNMTSPVFSFVVVSTEHMLWSTINGVLYITTRREFDSVYSDETKDLG